MRAATREQVHTIRDASSGGGLTLARPPSLKSLKKGGVGDDEDERKALEME
jgi:hypothetical protein